MATGSLPATSLFKAFLRIFLTFVLVFFFSIGVVGRFEFTFRVYAAAWYTAIGGGVLSGEEINNPSIPSSPAPPYDPEAVQNTSYANGNPAVGVLVSSRSQNVQSGGSNTSDAFIKNIGIDLSLDRYNAQSMSNVNGIVELASCVAPTLNPSMLYKTTASCLSAMTSYNLSSDGLAIVVVDDPVSSLNFDRNITQTNGARRLLVVTNSRVSYGASLADLDLSVLSTNASNCVVRGSVEGPVVSKSKIVLPNDLNSSPGAVVTYNPAYVVELSAKGRSNNMEIKGLLESKSSWRYE